MDIKKNHTTEQIHDNWLSGFISRHIPNQTPRKLVLLIMWCKPGYCLEGNYLNHNDCTQILNASRYCLRNGVVK